jgi:hypothetical protein
MGFERRQKQCDGIPMWSNFLQTFYSFRLSFFSLKRFKGTKKQRVERKLRYPFPLNYDSPQGSNKYFKEMRTKNVSTKFDEVVTKYIQLPWEKGYERQNQDQESVSHYDFECLDPYGNAAGQETIAAERTRTSVGSQASDHLADSQAQEPLVEDL